VFTFKCNHIRFTSNLYITHFNSDFSLRLIIIIARIRMSVLTFFSPVPWHHPCGRHHSFPDLPIIPCCRGVGRDSRNIDNLRLKRPALVQTLLHINSREIYIEANQINLVGFNCVTCMEHCNIEPQATIFLLGLYIEKIQRSFGKLLKSFS
jgi:hypothetical protein